MKFRNLLVTGLAAAALLLPAACTEDIAPDRMAAGGRGPALSLTAGTAVGTRAGTAIQSTVFDAGETVNAYITATDGTVVGAPTVYTTEAVSAGRNPLTPDVQPYFPLDDAQKLNVYALYPPTVTSGTTAFTVSPDQLAADGGTATRSGYKASDLMWASLSDITRTAGTVSTTANLPFAHKMVKLVVKADVAPSDAAHVGTVTSVKLKGVSRRIGFTPATGAMGDEATLADRGDIVFGDSGEGNDDDGDDVTDGHACLFPPQSLQRGDFLEVTTTEGTAKFALSLAAAKAFVPGGVYRVLLHLGAQNLKETATIDEWPDDKNLEVDPLGAGNLQIDEIAEIDPDDAATYDAGALTDLGEYRPKSAVVVRSSGDALTLGTDYTLEYFNNTAAGSYAVVVATGLGTYAGKTAARSYLIKAGTISYDPEPAAATLTYTGAAQPLIGNTPHAQKSGGAGEVPVKYCLSENGYYSATVPTATDAGTYTVWYKVDDTDGFKGIGKRSFTVTVDKATIDVTTATITAPAANDLTFNEKYQQLVTAGSCTVGGEDVTVSYCLGTDAANAPATGYKADVPSVLNAGTYYVWWQVGDDNHYGTDPQCVTVTVAKAPGRIDLYHGSTKLNSTDSPLLLDISDRKDATKVITIDRAGTGVISAEVTSGASDISIELSGNRITVTRLTEVDGEATIRVSVASEDGGYGNNYLPVSTTCKVSLNKCGLHLSGVKSTDQRYLGYLVSTAGNVYPPTEEGVAMLGPGEQLAGVITYVGTTNTAHGFVMALHDANGGAAMPFSSANAAATGYTPAITGYSWTMGTAANSKALYETATSRMGDAGSITPDTYWDLPTGYHWTLTTGNETVQSWGRYVSVSANVNYEWVFDYGSLLKNYHTNTTVHTEHTDNCKVRPIIAF